MTGTGSPRIALSRAILFRTLQSGTVDRKRARGSRVQTDGQHSRFHHPNSMHDPGHCCLEEAGVEHGL